MSMTVTLSASAPLLAFVTVSAAVIATPGPDTALTVRNTLRGGRGAGLATAAGVAAGQLLWAVATSLGLAALLLRWEAVYLALQYAGAGWLMVLGAQTLLQAWRPGHAPMAAAPARTPLGRPQAFALGVANDLANPKIALYFASVLPQFASTGPDAFASFLALGALFAAMTLAWLSVYVIALSHLGGRWRGGRLARAAQAAAGLALAALGLRSALHAH